MIFILNRHSIFLNKKNFILNHKKFSLNLSTNSRQQQFLYEQKEIPDLLRQE